MLLTHQRLGLAIVLKVMFSWQMEQSCAVPEINLDHHFLSFPLLSTSTS